MTGRSSYRPPAGIAHRSHATDALFAVIHAIPPVEKRSDAQQEAMRYLIWYLSNLERTLDALEGWHAFRLGAEISSMPGTWRD